MFRLCSLTCCLIALAAGLRAQHAADGGGAVAAPVAPSYTPMTGSERLGMYVYNTYGPFAYLRSGVTAGLSQWEDDPEEWPQGMKGYGYRFGSRFARFAIGETIELGAGAALGEDPRYFPCECSGTWRRGWYAATRTLIAKNRSGQDRFAFARAAGVFGSSTISVLWYPTNYSPVADGLQFGALSLASKAGLNVFKEFWPDIRRKVFRRK